MMMMMMMMGWKTSVKNSLHLSGSIHSIPFIELCCLATSVVYVFAQKVPALAPWRWLLWRFRLFLGLHWAAVLGVHLATWTRTAEWKLACWVCWVVFCEFSLAYQLPTRVLSISFYIYISLVPPALSPTVHFAVSETAHVTWSKQVNNDWIMWMWWSFYVCKFPEAYPQNLVDCLARCSCKMWQTPWGTLSAWPKVCLILKRRGWIAWNPVSWQDLQHDFTISLKRTT